MEGITLTVSQLNDYVRRLLASDPIVQHITLRGEISNFKPYASGHWYFTLKDDTGRIDCALFRQYTYGVPFMPQDGMRVLVTGSAGLYVQGGKFQFYADGMTQDGVGDLYRRYLELKERLTAEGLFDASRKRPLPLLPRAVGIVTSESGAVQHDIRTVAGRRFPGLPLVLRPAQVQGDGAAQDIVRGIEQLSRRRGIDVIIVGRGGGSLEDLWAFNEEIVARAIYRSRIPVISAVGHEIDFTIADFVADRRAETPTAAAEMAVPDIRELMQRAESWQNSLMADLKKKVSYADLRAEKLFAEMRHVLQGRVNAYRHELESCRLLLDENHPYRVLRKGYAVLEDAAGRNLASIRDLRDGQSYRLKLKDGSATFRVTELAVTKEERNDDI